MYHSREHRGMTHHPPPPPTKRACMYVCARDREREREGGERDRNFEEIVIVTKSMTIRFVSAC